MSEERIEIASVSDGGVSEDELDQLMAQLGSIANRLDPVPAAVREAARAAFAWCTVDAELAALTFDSWADDRALVGVRGGGARQLTFEAEKVIVEIQLSGGPTASLVGQIVPAGAGSVEVRHEGGSTTVDVDALGRFTAGRLPGGPLSLRCSGGGTAVPVETEWVAV
ncbi:MAG TPA: hypothetical protein VNT56_08665 [Acidimicrobiales bacterium]|jgi:hypothetical protein|nr:hypothetical protein [Acidimicrobiales bacterium]